MKTNLWALFMVVTSTGFAQILSEEKLPYYEVPEYPSEFTAGTMAARMVDALGFRLYWSSEGLTETDLAFKPVEDVRTAEETINHILELSYIILNATMNTANGKVDSSTLSYPEKRKRALVNLKTAADILRTTIDVSQYKIIFGDNEIPFWNQINGPIADSIWHCGQLASYRRSSGNPINPNINHFQGTVTKQ